MLKKNLSSIAATIIVIGILIFLGPAQAINVNLTTQDIDTSTDTNKEITIEVNVKDTEFLPLLYTNLTFNKGTGTIKLTGSILIFLSACYN